MRPILGLLLLSSLPLHPGASEPRAAARPDAGDPLDRFSARLQVVRGEFESALAAPAGELDVRGASRRFDEALLDLHWELGLLDERLHAERAGAWRFLRESSLDELRLSWGRLHEVAAVTPHVRALVRLQLEMEALVDAGRVSEAIRLFEARLPEPLDPLDWPAVVRRRMRDVERLARDAAALDPEFTVPGARESGSREAEGPIRPR